MKKIISYLFVLLFVPGMVSAQCNVCYGHKKVTRTENCSYCQGVGSFSEKVTKTCTNCGGKGYTTNSCSSCNGRGTVTTTKRCSACNGAGGHWKPKTCWSCQGSGKEYYTDYYFNERRSKACSKCGGDGSINELVKCTTCGGNKNITTNTTCSSCSGAGTLQRDCYSCGGRGTISETRTRTCNKCNGAGKISKEIACPVCGKW